jgi:hypothetical protein
MHAYRTPEIGLTSQVSGDPCLRSIAGEFTASTWQACLQLV